MNTIIGPKKGKTKQKGYIVVNLGNGRFERLHRIIWIAVNGPIPNGYEIHHKDGDRENNNITNLELMEIGRHASLHMKGKKKSEEFKRHMSLKMKGRKMSEETKHKISLKNKGKILTEKHKQNISLGLKSFNSFRKRSKYGNDTSK